ncbi:MAG: YfhO family protein [Oscillospiraceae bacterium]|jgi:uncharacterized membrane protein YfhO|nr:YfhO family protein [Oscillospiraceae bacterium]
MKEQLSAGQRAGRRFGGWIKDNGYVTLAFFGSALIMLFVWFCFEIIPFGKMTILRMDLYHQYGPLFAELYERIVQRRSLLYSWNTGLGGGFLGNFYNYLSSPTAVLLLLFGHKNTTEAIAMMILLKAAAASAAFSYMLRRMFGKNSAAIAAFGILYSFCGFFIAYYWNVMWLDAMALFPLVALGIDLILRKRKFMLYTVALALTLFSNYYMGYMVCLFSVLFFLTRFFAAHAIESTVRPVEKEAPLWVRLKENRFFQSAGLFALGSVLAAGLVAFALLPVYFTLKTSSATSGTMPKDYETYFSIFDFFANHLADVAPTIRSSGSNVMPNVYCGILTLVLTPLFLFTRSISLKDKILHLALLALLFFSFNTNILNFIWHGMHFPNDLPYRFSFLYSFLLLLIAYRTLLHLRELHSRALVVSGISLAAFIILAEELHKIAPDQQHNLEDLTIYLSIAFAVIYTIVLLLMRKPRKYNMSALAVLLLCCVITETCAASTNRYHISQPKSDFVSDLGAFQEVKKEIDKRDKGFFRMELSKLRAYMDPAWFDYPGVSVFSSMAYERTSNLESHLGLHSNYINSYIYDPQTPVYNAMHSLKYIADNAGYKDVLNPQLYTELFSHDKYTVFQNNYTLSVAYWVSPLVKDWNHDNSDPFFVQKDYWQRASGAAEVFERLQLTPDNDYFDANVATSDVSEDYVSYYDADPASGNAKLRFTVAVETARNVYIYADSNKIGKVTILRALDENGDAQVNDARAQDSPCIWDLGVVTPDEPLVLELSLNNDAEANGGFYCFLYGLNMDAFLEGYNTLRQGELHIISHKSDTDLTGTITAPADGLLYTSIPYDEGWQVTIDGKRVPASEYVPLANKALLAVPLTQGDHTVSLHYEPQGLRLGLLVSFGTLAVLLCGWGVLLLLRRRERQRAAFRPIASYVPSPVLRRTDGEDLPPQPVFASEHLDPADFSLDLPEVPLSEDTPPADDMPDQALSPAAPSEDPPDQGAPLGALDALEPVDPLDLPDLPPPPPNDDDILAPVSQEALERILGIPPLPPSTVPPNDDDILGEPLPEPLPVGTEQESAPAAPPSAPEVPPLEESSVSPERINAIYSDLQAKVERIERAIQEEGEAFGVEPRGET